MDINKVMLDIIRFGPTRVVINKEGEAVNIRRAIEMGIYPDVVFIRDDGWSLSAPEEFAEVARDMWIKDWAYCTLPSLVNLDMLGLFIGNVVCSCEFKTIARKWHPPMSEEELNKEKAKILKVLDEIQLEEENP